MSRLYKDDFHKFMKKQLHLNLILAYYTKILQVETHIEHFESEKARILDFKHEHKLTMYLTKLTNTIDLNLQTKSVVPAL